MAYDYQLVRVTVDDGVAVATIDAPPFTVGISSCYVASTIWFANRGVLLPKWIWSKHTGRRGPG